MLVWPKYHRNELIMRRTFVGSNFIVIFCVTGNQRNFGQNPTGNGQFTAPGTFTLMKATSGASFSALE